MEEDEAGRLKAFRQKFGRGWDSETLAEGEEPQEEDSLMDLISDFGEQGGDGKKGKK